MCIMFSYIYHTLYSPLLSEDASAYEHLILLYIIYIYSNGKVYHDEHIGSLVISQSPLPGA